jgi:hypothetical protein
MSLIRTNDILHKFRHCRVKNYIKAKTVMREFKVNYANKLLVCLCIVNDIVGLLLEVVKLDSKKSTFIYDILANTEQRGFRKYTFLLLLSL